LGSLKTEYRSFVKHFKRSTLHQFITNVLKKRWQEQKCEPAQRREFFVKILESGKWEDQSVCHSADRREEASLELEVGSRKTEVLSVYQLMFRLFN
jgi:hypothetical protein